MAGGLGSRPVSHGVNVASLKQPAISAAGVSLQATGFSGKTVTVEFLKIKDSEPRDIFVGVNEYQARIMRGVPVTIPIEVFNNLKRATYLDQEFNDPNNPEVGEWVEKQRYAYNVLSQDEQE